MRYPTRPTLLATLLAAALLSSVGCGEDPAPKSTSVPDAAGTDEDTTTGDSDAIDPGVKSGLTLSDPNVRGCEILLTEGTAKIESVSFDGTVVGTFIREAPKVAVSFVAAKDAPMGPSAIQLTVKGDATQVQVKKVSCVDAKAATLASVTATLN
jgi:hypothetical protein